MSENQELHQCPVCSKRYKRREHLQRHWTSHGTSRPYRCSQCSRTFQRHDVLNRHARTCEARAKGLMAPSARRRACDLCVRQKKACTSTQQCQNCERLSVPCTYSFATANSGEGRDDHISRSGVQVEGESESWTEGMTISSVDDPSPAGAGATAFEDLSAVIFGNPSELDFPDTTSTNASWLDFLNLMSDVPVSDGPSHRELATQKQAENVSYSFKFLHNFTSRTGLIQSFDCGTPALREQTLSAFLQQQQQVGGEPSTPTATLTGYADVVTVPVLSDSLVPAVSVIPAPPIRNSWLHDPLMIKVHQIVVRAREVVIAKPRNSAVTVEWSPLLEQKCLDFFSPNNVRRFLALYWSIWHPNVNFVHRPTFDPSTSKSILLAAMAVIGASMSPDPVDKEHAKAWFNCVEEMVFSDDDLCSEPLYTWDTGILIPATQRRKVQALQAAYIVCLYQNWEGTDTSKRRIRRFRYSTVVSVARDIGLSSARHQDHSKQIGCEFEWKSFAAKEELIRTFLWIFLLDHAFVIFNNLPPRTVIKEMKMHLARPEACFQAGTAEECLEEIKKWSSRSPFVSTLTLREAVEMVCKGGMSEDMHQSLADMGPLNLFAVVSAFHSLIFQHQNSFGGDGHLVSIRNALSNWKSIWEFYSSKFSSVPPHAMLARDMPLTPENAWRRIGFMRHAPEFWLLASAIMGRLTREDPWPRHESSWTGNQTELPLSSPGTATPDRILKQYDQTSMRQVNELISEFQKVQLHPNED